MLIKKVYIQKIFSGLAIIKYGCSVMSADINYLLILVRRFVRYV